MQPCEKNSQCGENQCCALRLKLFGYKGYCLRTKSLGEVCSPNVMVRRTNSSLFFLELKSQPQIQMHLSNGRTGIVLDIFVNKGMKKVRKK